MKKSVKKALTFISLSILLTSLYKYEKTNNPTNYISIKEDDGYTIYSYSNGKVYIGKKSELRSLIGKIGPNDVVVIDQRNNKEDPNMKIISSYRITNANFRNEIIRILHQYEKDNPSSWKRSITSMRREWLVHNLLHHFDVQLKRTKDVDFNNKDETLYRRKK